MNSSVIGDGHPYGLDWIRIYNNDFKIYHIYIYILYIDRSIKISEETMSIGTGGNQKSVAVLCLQFIASPLELDVHWIVG
jgi:hypothetical protein